LSLLERTYGPWAVWVKTIVTIVGLTLAVASSYITSTYVLPRIF
jgi:hypothetical protein